MLQKQLQKVDGTLHDRRLCFKPAVSCRSLKPKHKQAYPHHSSSSQCVDVIIYSGNWMVGSVMICQWCRVHFHTYIASDSLYGESDVLLTIDFRYPIHKMLGWLFWVPSQLSCVLSIPKVYSQTVVCDASTVWFSYPMSGLLAHVATCCGHLSSGLLPLAWGLWQTRFALVASCQLLRTGAANNCFMFAEMCCCSGSRCNRDLNHPTNVQKNGAATSQDRPRWEAFAAAGQVDWLTFTKAVISSLGINMLTKSQVGHPVQGYGVFEGWIVLGGLHH